MENIEDIDELTSAKMCVTIIDMLNSHLMSLPDADFIAYVRSDSYREVLRSLTEDKTVDDDMRKGAALMSGFIEKTLSTDTEELSHIMGVDRTRLYRGVRSPGAPTYPCEAAWRGLDGIRAAELVEQSAALYRSCGLRVSPDVHERADYLGIQLLFERYLVNSQIEALETDDEDIARRCYMQQRGFADEHLSWVHDFIVKALPVATTDCYRGHLMMLDSFLGNTWRS